MSEIGVIIGRFQPLHKGHELLIHAASEKHKSVFVFIGSSNISNRENPYDFSFRKEIIKIQGFSGINIFPLPDSASNEEWIQHIIKEIPKHTEKITLYCGDIQNDSAVIVLQKFKEKLPFSLEIIEIARSIIPISATQVREMIQEGNTIRLDKMLSQKTIEKLANFEKSPIIPS